MRLDSLIGELADDVGSTRVTGFAIDNRKVAPGTTARNAVSDRRDTVRSLSIPPRWFAATPAT